ncbi:hypothetical protein LZ198_13350 [Myxococcus sp. K15C18031901]|uniref:hypothetical protein n=1 Tax=Myxococcus dinghuensis TaxID=2906761 RepID=UPI0020A80ED0|nr:hypothetical protein [Myxococcus dinghuensis]MCP3099855.1 hypothetical protein [Myxococcus dinghuensis]
MSGRESPVTTVRRNARTPARDTRARSLRPWPLTLAIAVSLGLLLYVVTASLPYLISSPTTDPNFGALNHCLGQVLPLSRLGWAVSPDASRAAAYGSHRVAVCDAHGISLQRDVAGTLALAFDGANRLWVATGAGLLREDGATFAPVGDFAPVALAGHAQGVLALDVSGQLVSVAADGALLGQTQVPPGGGRLSVGADNTLAAVLSEGTLRVYDARTLMPYDVQPPCPVETVWWLDTPERLLIGCAPAGGPSFVLDVRTGAREAVPEGRPLTPARRLGSRPLYVQGCDGFPCTAPPP